MRCFSPSSLPSGVEASMDLVFSPTFLSQHSFKTICHSFFPLLASSNSKCALKQVDGNLPVGRHWTQLKKTNVLKDSKRKQWNQTCCLTVNAGCGSYSKSHLFYAAFANSDVKFTFWLEFFQIRWFHQFSGNEEMMWTLGPDDAIVMSWGISGSLRVRPLWHTTCLVALWAVSFPAVLWLHTDGAFHLKWNLQVLSPSVHDFRLSQMKDDCCERTMVKNLVVLVSLQCQQFSDGHVKDFLK